MSNNLPAPVGYAGLTALDRNKHQGLGVAEQRRGEFAAKLHGVPVAAAELIHAARHYPVVFARDAANGRYALVAVTGLAAGSNLFVTDSGAWEPFCYVPAYVRRWPFATVQVDTGRAADAAAKDALICVDEHGLAPGGAALFDARGEPTDAWRAVETLVRELEGARLQTEAFIAVLTERQLLEPFQAHAFPKQGRDLHVTGMYRVNETKLNALEGKLLKGMQKRGELSRIHAHLASLDNFRYLMDRATARGQTTT